MASTGLSICYIAWVLSNEGQIPQQRCLYQISKPAKPSFCLTIIEMEEIPKDLVINWDYTGIKYVPVGNWTMPKEGSKRIGLHDKRQITAVFGCTMEGEFLPPQVIYGGKTSLQQSLQIPGILHSLKITGQMKKQQTQNILLPFIKQKRASLKLDPQYPALVIFDGFKCQCTPNILSILDKRHSLC